jgi:putative DNA primase/helicase
MSECPICNGVDTCQVDKLFVTCRNSSTSEKVKGYKFVHKSVRSDGWVWEPESVFAELNGNGHSRQGVNGFEMLGDDLSEAVTRMALATRKVETLTEEWEKASGDKKKELKEKLWNAKDWLKHLNSQQYRDGIKGSREPEKDDARNHFVSSLEAGLIYKKAKFNKEGKHEGFEDISIGDHLTALAFVDSPTKDEAQLYIEFKARQEVRTLTIKRSDLAGEGTDTIKLLNEHSYYHNRKHKSLLLDYLNKLGKNCDINYIVTQKTGWIKDSFVLPDRSFGNPHIRFQQVDKPATPVFEEIGTLEEWKTNIAALCVGNSRLTFALGVSLSAPLSALLSIESGGYHLYGATSTGKTSALWVAASVYGQEKQNVMPWRTTSNALEYKAAARNNLALMLDEIGQCTAQDVAQSAYLLANGQGKSRMRKDLTMRENLKWNLTFLSNGEHTLSSYLERGGIETKGGQENRMPSIPAVVKNGSGAFEICHGLEPSDFSSTIKRNSQKYCGTPFTAFMTQLIEERSKDGFDSRLLSRHTEIRKALTSLAPYNEVLERVADRMACIQLGIEMAIDYGILPHSHEDARWSVQTMFCDWVNDRGGAVNFELKQTLDRIEHLLITQEFSDRVLDLTVKETKYDPTVRNLLAYKRGEEFFVPPAVFDKEFVGELSRDTLVTALIKREWLTPGTDGKTAQSRKVDGKSQRVYVFQRFWVEKD